MKMTEGERILVLGGSRGLGAAFVHLLKSQNHEVTSISRKSSESADFSNQQKWDLIVARIRELNPTRIIYCAAGGPYGSFGQFQWKDHAWALKTTFEFPAFLIHSLLHNPFTDLKQFLVIGSSVAESQADPGAAAYSAAKHAIRGLVTTLQKEGVGFDLRILSPGYMATQLLPSDSAPRREGKAQDPFKIAALMIQSISDPALRLQNQSFD
jgi:cyclic-di-GMP-binding biofilm dispersal mediator protein